MMLHPQARALLDLIEQRGFPPPPPPEIGEVHVLRQPRGLRAFPSQNSRLHDHG